MHKDLQDQEEEHQMEEEELTIKDDKEVVEEPFEADQEAIDLNFYLG